MDSVFINFMAPSEYFDEFIDWLSEYNIIYYVDPFELLNYNNSESDRIMFTLFNEHDASLFVLRWGYLL